MAVRWVDVSGYEGLYQVSDEGDVRSIDRVTTGKRKRNIHGKELSQGTNSFGYMVVALSKDGKVEMRRVHRLVAYAFIPNDDGKPYINHKDGNPKNNAVDNLEWCTQKENVQHAYDIGLNPSSGILTFRQIKEIKELYVPYSREFGANALAKKYGVNQTTILNAIHGKRKIILD